MTQTKTLKQNKNPNKITSLNELNIERGETQKDVNTTILNELVNVFDQNASLNVLDLPCGEKIFLKYLKTLFPNAKLSGADIVKPDLVEDVEFYKMDLTKDFSIPKEETYDLISSISGVMMFSNTKNFIENCADRLKTGGMMVLTNDNSSTIIDRLGMLFLGRSRQFKLVYEDNEAMTQNISIQELIRLLRINGIEIQKITYTSFYLKDLKYLPLALLFAPFQYLYLNMIKSSLPKGLLKQMFHPKQFLYKHYIIYGIKK